MDVGFLFPPWSSWVLGNCIDSSLTVYYVKIFQWENWCREWEVGLQAPVWWELLTECSGNSSRLYFQENKLYSNSVWRRYDIFADLFVALPVNYRLDSSKICLLQHERSDLCDALLKSRQLHCANTTATPGRDVAHPVWHLDSSPNQALTLCFAVLTRSNG